MKIGDHVKITSSPYCGPQAEDIGSIVKASKDKRGDWLVDVVNPSGYNHKTTARLGFFEHELELIEEEKSIMTQHVGMITNSTGCTVVIGSQVYTVAADHPNFAALQEAYAEGRVDDLQTLVSVRKSIESFTQGTNIRIEGSQLFYGDRKIESGLANRIVRLMREGREGFAKPLVAFMENLMLNPSFRAIEGLYEWLEKSNLPITPDGHFIAWKIVRNDFRDLRTGKFDNSPGQIVEVPRNAVDEDPNATCSNGLHICSNEYLPQYGGFYGGRGGNTKVVMVKVNPKDVGAFPKDYNTAKGRVCRYEVLHEVTEGEIEAVTAESQSGSGVYKGRGTKTVARLGTTNTDRAEIILEFTDGSTQRTKNRIGDTVSFDQSGNIVTLRPSGRTITINS